MLIEGFTRQSVPHRMHWSVRLWLTPFCCALALLTGCVPGPYLVPSGQRQSIDRKIVEYPAGFEFQVYADHLNGPTAFCWNELGEMIIAEGGIDGADPHIFGFHKDGTRFEIYPFGTRIPIFKPGFRIYGPIGGMVYYHGRLLVSHRDENDLGTITSFGMDGSHTTIIAGLPAQGDYSVTDLVISPINGRLYFGLGSATNSGVVGLDNWDVGWIHHHRTACDIPFKELSLLGYRFDAKNPEASIFAPDLTVTVPFQPFGNSYITQIPPAPLRRPTGAIFSISPDGGDPRVEAWGVRNPVGLLVTELGGIYFTDQGMELRGTRPIVDDPDVLFRFVSDTWYGWPDFSRNLHPISDDRFQPPGEMIVSTGYTRVGYLIDHQASNLRDPDRRLIQAEFKPLSGASKMDLVPGTGPFREFTGNLVVALWGDRAPFATSGQALNNPPPGYKVVLVDRASGNVKDFIYNTMGGPASRLPSGRDQAMERPIDPKFGPDGNLYILDFGYVRMKGAHEKSADGTGKIFIVSPIPAKPTTEK